MYEKIVKFIGKLSGDNECFCWEVDAKTFKNITGKELTEFDYVNIVYDNGDYTKPIPVGNEVRLYPNDVFGLDDSDSVYEFEIKIKRLPNNDIYKGNWTKNGK